MSLALKTVVDYPVSSVKYFSCSCSNDSLRFKLLESSSVLEDQWYTADIVVTIKIWGERANAGPSLER